MKNAESFDCDYCEKTKQLKKDRNCGWQGFGKCDECDNVPFEGVEMAPDGSKFICLTCGSRVKFGRAAELVLGKYRVPGCPKSMISQQAVFLIQLVDWSEKTGKLPTAQTLMEESLLYFDIRNFVVSETNIAEEEMRPKETA